MTANNIKPKFVTLEIHADDLGKPYLKKVERRKNSGLEGRGRWMPIGKATDYGIDRVISVNRKAGLIVLPDEENVYRVLVLTE